MADGYAERLALNPWEPITEPIDLKHLGKLEEELGECISAASRCTIQGMDGADPETGKINRQWLAEEMGDVLCHIEVNVEHFGLDVPLILGRVARKKDHIKAWHALARPTSGFWYHVLVGFYQGIGVVLALIVAIVVASAVLR